MINYTVQYITLHLEEFHQKKTMHNICSSLVKHQHIIKTPTRPTAYTAHIYSSIITTDLPIQKKQTHTKKSYNIGRPFWAKWVKH